MAWLTFILSGLKRVPLRVWLLLLFLAACAFALWYAHHAGVREGRQEIQSQWDESVARGREEIARIDRENAAHEAKARAEAVAIGENRRRDLQDQIAERDRTIAGLRAGTVRLHDRWENCLSSPQAGDAADLSGGPVPADELRGEIAAEISEGFDADSRISRLIEFQDVLRKQCMAVASQ